MKNNQGVGKIPRNVGPEPKKTKKEEKKSVLALGGCDDLIEPKIDSKIQISIYGIT